MIAAPCTAIGSVAFTLSAEPLADRSQLTSMRPATVRSVAVARVGAVEAAVPSRLESIGAMATRL